MSMKHKQGRGGWLWSILLIPIVLVGPILVKLLRNDLPWMNGRRKTEDEVR